VQRLQLAQRFLVFALLFQQQGAEEAQPRIGVGGELGVDDRPRRRHVAGAVELEGEASLQVGIVGLLAGSGATIAGKLHMRMWLRDAVHGDLLWSRNFEGLAVQPEDLRQQIVTRVGAVLPCAADTRAGSGRAVAVRASQLYLEACESFLDLDGDAAAGLLQQVTAIAPEFGKGWAALAFAQALSGNANEGVARAAAFDQARANARKAIALDPGAGRAYYALAAILPEIGTWQRRMGIIDRGLAADPDNPDLYSLRGTLLDLVGRWQEGSIAHRRAFELDPFNPSTLTNVASSLALHDRLDEGEHLLESATAAWQHSAALWQAHFMIDVRIGDPRRALAMLEDPARPAIHEAWVVGFWKLMLRARIDPTPANVAAARRFIIDTATEYQPADMLAATHPLAALGQIDDAYRMAFSGPPREEQFNEVLFRSYMNAFRKDPRFMLLARQRGLVQIWQATGRWPDFCASPTLPYDCRKAAQAVMTAPMPRQIAL